MPSFADLLQQGASNAWIFIPSAVLLGALHGLEPGHSKTMMAAFIVAIRGSVMQAVMLGLMATISHTAVVWGIALVGMSIWQGAAPEAFEPWLQLLSGIIIVAMALWMIMQVYRERRPDHHHDDHGHDHDHRHDHHHGHHAHGHGHHHSHGDDIDIPQVGYQDAHERAHAAQIARRFKGQNVTNWQIALFGLTGGLIPCPAAITVLLLCLQVEEFALGTALVLCFSIGLAITLVAVGVVAALSVHHANRRLAWLGSVAARAPYLSGVLLIVVGLYVAAYGIIGLTT